MKPNILVLYYTQSGQLRDILNNLLKDITNNANIDFHQIEPIHPFPFPWTPYQFFDTMPETVERIPIDIKPLPTAIKLKSYDLVILGYQPWFLNPSLPITGFLKSAHSLFLRDKSVLTIIGCRNMWLNAQEEIKKELTRIGANLVGNIVFTDTHPNIISTLTIIRWAFTGRKQATRLLPAAGVQDHDIKASARFGTHIHQHITQNTLHALQSTLLHHGAIYLKPSLILLEQRGIKNFQKFATYIRKKGEAGDPHRKTRVLLFKNLLIIAIFILSPITTFAAFLQLQLRKNKLTKDLAYFKSVSYEKDRI